MEIWAIWVASIASMIEFFSHYFGVSEAIAIISFTLVARLLLTPISLKSSYEMVKSKNEIAKLKSELDQLKERYKDDSTELGKKTVELYKRNGIKIIGGASILNIASQTGLGLGIFQALRNATLSSKFLWISNIGKPDIILAVIVGFLAFLSMQFMPGVAEQQSWLLVLIPAVISAVALISFPSALGLYWATSNIATLAQTLALRLIILREGRIASGAL